MIDRKLFALDRLLDVLLDTEAGNVNQWITLVEIAGQPNGWTVRCGSTWLRRGNPPIWDIYGDRFWCAESALLWALKAPVPPHLLKPECWPHKGEGMENAR